MPVRAGCAGASLPRKCTRVRQANEAACPLDPYQILPDKCKYVDMQTWKLQESPEQVPTGEMPRSVLLSCERRLVDKASSHPLTPSGGCHPPDTSSPSATPTPRTTPPHGQLTSTAHAPRPLPTPSGEARRPRHRDGHHVDPHLLRGQGRRQGRRQDDVPTGPRRAPGLRGAHVRGRVARDVHAGGGGGVRRHVARPAHLRAVVWLDRAVDLRVRGRQEGARSREIAPRCG